MKITFEYDYKITDKVFHATPDGAQGIVIDVSYSAYSNRVKYLVVFGMDAGSEMWCSEYELSRTKVF